MLAILPPSWSYSPKCVEKLFGNSGEGPNKSSAGGARERKAPFMSHCPSKDSRFRRLKLFSKQFRKVNSQKFAVAISPSTPHSDGYRGGGETYVRLHWCKHLFAAGNIHNFAYLSIGVTSSSGRGPSGVPREVISGVPGWGYAQSCM